MSYCLIKKLFFCFLDVENGDVDGFVDVFVIEVEGREEDVEDKGDVEVIVEELLFFVRE